MYVPNALLRTNSLISNPNEHKHISIIETSSCLELNFDVLRWSFLLLLLLLLEPCSYHSERSISICVSHVFPSRPSSRYPQFRRCKALAAVWEGVKRMKSTRFGLKRFLDFAKPRYILKWNFSFIGDRRVLHFFFCFCLYNDRFAETSND